jgi:nicotinate-nucleotide pyrophosphorylase (carboxylating)
MNNEMILTEDNVIQALIERAFEEDMGSGDVTTNAILDIGQKARVIWVAKEKGVVAGLDTAQNIFQKLDPEINWQTHVGDGEEVESGSKIVKIEGSGRAILTAERIALNIAQRMSGIATMTQQFVAQIADLDTKILDTRKTVPGLRLLDKKQWRLEEVQIIVWDYLIWR